MKPVIIIGGGFSGIVALKICLENGFDAHCYERMDQFGGLWRYRETVDVDGIPSVTKNTIIDTSKEVGALSDFPPPDDFPNYMHNTKMIEYLGLFIKANNLESRVRYGHEVLRVQKADDYARSGDWKVLIQNKESSETFEVAGQAVLVCSGHHAFPNYQTFVGQDEFPGRIVHSHSYKEATEFSGKTVVVVGVGNSAMDAASELSFVCKQVYLSTRTGIWIAPRVGPNGRPLDFMFSRILQYTYDHFPNYWRNTFEDFVNSRFDHELYGLKPRHRIDQQHVTLSDIIPARILAGAIRVKGDVVRFSRTGVVFNSDEGKETPVDAAILCTGYKIRIPFLPENDDALPGAPPNNQVDLFERIFPVDLPHPTLAFMGMAQPNGPLFPIFELQARWVCRLLLDRNGPVKALKGYQAWPTSVSERAREVAKYRKSINDRYVASPRHTLEVDYVTYMDNLAKRVGCFPNLFKLAFCDPVLWWRLMSGPLLPYQYRLQGPNKWSKARSTIMTLDKRLESGFGGGRAKLNDRRRSGSFTATALVVAAVVAASGYFLATGTRFNPPVLEWARFLPQR